MRNATKVFLTADDTDIADWFLDCRRTRFVGQARRLPNQFNPAGGSACPTTSSRLIHTAQRRAQLWRG